MAPTSRQKSLAGPISVDIPRPTQSNGLLNKTASSSSSLYHQCSQLRSRLLQIPHFHLFFDKTASEQNSDPVTHLWDTLALGTPLCFLYNLLPPPSVPIDIDCHPNSAALEQANVKATKIATIKFIMAVQKMQQDGEWEEADLFQVTELTDRNMNGFVKVIKTVTSLVDRLPDDVFSLSDAPTPPEAAQSTSLSVGSPTDPSHPTPGPSLSVKEMDRKHNITELINTERKFVQDLEVMQKYATALSQRSVIDNDTILELFPGLNRLLDFQRRFLIKLEQVYEMAWPEQRWGRCFMECEHEFVVYGPYCVNYEHAVDVLLREEQHLMECADILHPKSDLPAFLIKPVQRLCKYPLLLESLVKACSPDEYPYYDELVEACAVTKRVTNRVNEAQRIAENRQIVKALEARIEDWKGHHITNFGHLLLQDFFNVTKSEVDREYHVFLFQKIILCCKEDPRSTMNLNKKVSKSNSLLKKQAPNPAPTAGGNFGANARNSNAPLLLKGRIFLNNVIEATPVGRGVSHDLRVSWKGDDDTEHFTLRCRNDEQMNKWEKQINQLILAGRRRTQSGASNSTSPAIARLNSGAAEPSNLVTFQNSEYLTMKQPSSASRSTTPHHGHTDANGFDLDDESDYIHQPSLYPIPASGRGTPMGSRRSGASQSMPPEREIQPGYERPRARTEDYMGPVMQQWRVNSSGMPVPPPPTGTLPTRPGQGRASSHISSEGGSFSTMSARGSLRTQQSSTRLRSTYESEGTGDMVARSSSAASGRSYSSQGSSSRMRSASISSPYTGAKLQQPPPLPNGYPSQPPPDGRGLKRDSNSSNSTEHSSDFSAPQSASPVTPYGSSESSLTHATLRHAMSNVTLSNGSKPPPSGPLTVKVKVHYNEDLFVIMVNRSTDFQELVDKVGKKIRLCGGRKEGSALRIRYRDEDGDMVLLGSNEDVQMAFDTSRASSGGQVTIFVA